MDFYNESTGNSTIPFPFDDIMYFDEVNQRVGIMKDSPSYTLDVNGTIKTNSDLICTNLYVTSSNIFTSNVTSSNISCSYITACNYINLPILSSVSSLSLSNIPTNSNLTLTYNTATWGSNTVVSTSNYVTPKTEWGSNTIVSTSNYVTPKTEWTCNNFISTSNYLTPKTIWTCNNFIATSNYLTPKVEATSNLAYSLSNVILGSNSTFMNLYCDNLFKSHSNYTENSNGINYNNSSNFWNIIVPKAPHCTYSNSSNNRFIETFDTFISGGSLSYSNSSNISTGGTIICRGGRFASIGTTTCNLSGGIGFYVGNNSNSYNEVFNKLEISATENTSFQNIGINNSKNLVLYGGSILYGASNIFMNSNGKIDWSLVDGSKPTSPSDAQGAINAGLATGVAGLLTSVGGLGLMWYFAQDVTKEMDILKGALSDLANSTPPRMEAGKGFFDVLKEGFSKFSGTTTNHNSHPTGTVGYTTNPYYEPVPTDIV